MSESANKIIVWMQASLDGYTQGPNGEFDWPVVAGELHEHFVDTLRDAGMFLYGRKIYEMMAGYWPIADTLPDSTDMQVAYAKVWKPMPKLAFSRSLETTEWNTTVVGDVEPERIEQFRKAAGGHLYLFGGSEIVAEFARHDLIDEYQVFTHPILLGGGTPLFSGVTGRRGMTLVETRVFNGSVIGSRHARTR